MFFLLKLRCLRDCFVFWYLYYIIKKWLACVLHTSVCGVPYALFERCIASWHLFHLDQYVWCFIRWFVANDFFFFLFSSFLYSPLKIRVGHSNFHNCLLIYWYFSFDPYFFIYIFCSWPICQFFFFNLIIGSIIIICYFFKFKPHSFDFFCFRLFYEFEFSFLFPSSIQNSKQSSHLLFLFQNRSSFSLLLFFFILLYNWFFFWYSYLLMYYLKRNNGKKYWS